VAEKKVGPPTPTTTETPAPKPGPQPTQHSTPWSERKGQEIEHLVEQGYRGVLEGKTGRWSGEREALEKQKVYESAKQAERIQYAELEEDALSRGLARSGLAHRDRRSVALATARRISAGEREIVLAKVVAEFEDKMMALNMAQKALDSRRSYELGKEQISATREATAARTALGYAQIKAQKQIASMQAGRAAAALGLQKEQFEFAKQRYEESKIPLGAELQEVWGTDKIPASVFGAITGYGF
jgi:hypothetical protein